MNTCKNCGNVWTWSQALRRMLTFRIGMNCPYCEEKQYISASSRRKISMLSLLSLIVLPIAAIFKMSLFLSVVLILTVSMVTFVLTPFILELSNEEEPLW